MVKVAGDHARLPPQTARMGTMNLNEVPPEVQFAIDVAERAGILAQSIQKRLTEPALSKKDRSPVTVADFAIQGLVGWLLQQQQPGEDALVAEEDSRLLQCEEGETTLEQVTEFLSEAGLPADPESVCQWIDRGSSTPRGRYWTLDPIDGTKGFLRQEQYATALAHIEAGQVRIGVLACPNLPFPGNPSARLGALFVAVRGHGSWARSLQGARDFQSLRVSALSDPVQARLVRSVEAGHTNTTLFEQVLHQLGSRVEPVLMDSQAKYGLLASGRGELMLRLISSARRNYKERIWDHAAGSLVVEEAGGKVTDLDGKDLDFSRGSTLARNRGIVASNGMLHEMALSVVRKLGG